VGGGGDSGADVDAGPPCNLQAPFGSPVLTTNVNSTDNDEYARLSGDLLTMYLSSDRNISGSIGFDLYQSSRTAIGQPWTTPVRINQAGGGYVGGAGDQLAPTVTADGTSLYYASDETSSFKIYVATRANAQADFGAPGVWSVSTSTNDRDPYVLPAGDVVYFSSDRSGSQRIFRVVNTTSWGTPEEQMNYGTGNIAPVVTPDELTIFFMGRPGTTGSFDIYAASRAQKSDAFGAPTRVDAVSDSSALDAPTYITPDGCTLYFSSNRPGGPGNSEIWEATRPK
jgi:Tol biopolymer transport system component